MNNSLAEVHPELISEWSEKNLPLTPDDITFGSNKKVWWKGVSGKFFSDHSETSSGCTSAKLLFIAKPQPPCA